MSLWDDLQADITREAFEAPAAKRPAAKRPDANAWSNAQSFVSEGYVARVIRQTCKGCGGHVDFAQGIFHAERKPGDSARRLQKLGRGAQWPLSTHCEMEVEIQEVEWCAACLRDLGFTIERPAQRGFVMN